ncbi:MAG: imidazoleglycerol-phosphate dehydratase HisB [Acidobacteria bacterium]|nr:imidazoleglycerol-phosphate dehydratase HisB [Acidobacteriota bacterium]
MARKARVERNTKETQVRAVLNIDGQGRARIATGIRFLDHMLEIFAKHGAFDLEVHAVGDLDVDQHHTVEDVGLVLGQAFREALGGKRGILRAGYFVMPMDESLAIVAVDLAGRPYLVYDARIRKVKLGDLQTELIEDFFHGFATAVGANVHVRLPYGRATHHKVEAIFKAFSRALRMACSRDPRLKGQVVSTKGRL